jgi:hypothetical protein
MLPRFLNQKEGKSFEEARDVCLLGHSDLVKIVNQTEMANFNEYHNNLFPTLGDWYGKTWIGLNKINTTEFVWSDLTEPVYSNYLQNEPDLSKSCVLATNYQQNWLWRSESCSSTWTFACERRNID